MHKQPVKLDELVLQLRKLLPKDSMTFGTALIVAEQQALAMRKLLGVKATRMPFDWVEKLPNVTLQVVSPHDLQQLTGRARVSGVTKLQGDGQAVISIASGNSHTHQRFTMAHELKHLIDGLHTDQIYAGMGNGNDEIRDARIESVANEFAAHLLMPRATVIKAWNYGIRGLPELAALFDVSEDAMNIRLMNLGLGRRVGSDSRSFLRAPHAPEAAGMSPVPTPLAPCTGHSWLRNAVTLLRAAAQPTESGLPAGGALLTVAEACELLRVSRWMLYRLIHSQELESISIGRRRLVPKDAVESLVSKLRREAAWDGTP